jgi:hypothetical protein
VQAQVGHATTIRNQVSGCQQAGGMLSQRTKNHPFSLKGFFFLLTAGGLIGVLSEKMSQDIASANSKME